MRFIVTVNRNTVRFSYIASKGTPSKSFAVHKAAIGLPLSIAVGSALGWYGMAAAVAIGLVVV